MSGPAERSLTGVVVRGARLAGAGFALTQALTLGTYLVLARLAAPEDFGVLAAGSIVIGLSGIFVESGMMAALIQRRDRLEEAASTALVSTAVSGLLLSLVALALAPLLGLLFGSREVTAVAAALSGVLFLTSLTIVPNALMQRRFSFARRVVVEPAAMVAFGATAIAACGSGMGAWGLVAGTYASAATQVIASWGLVRWRPDFRAASLPMWRELIGYGRHVVASSILMNGAMHAENTIVGRFLGTASLGQYSYAWRMGVLPQAIVLRVASYVLYPALSRIAADEDRLRGAFLRALRSVSLFALPGSLILLPLGEPLAVVVFGERWRPAGQALAAMCLFSAGHSFNSLASELWKAVGRPDLLPRMHLLAGASSVGLVAAFLPLGLTGVGAALSLSACLVAGYAVRGASRILTVPVGRLLAEIRAPLLSALLMAGALYPLEHLMLRADTRGITAGLGLLAAEGALGVLIYLGGLHILAPGTTAQLARAVRSWPRPMGGAMGAP